jgi:hypothetical protein
MPDETLLSEEVSLELMTYRRFEEPRYCPAWPRRLA